MKIRPISFRDACAFVDAHHRHHKKPQGHKFSLCLMDGEKLVGVVIVGRPVARMLDDGLTCEVPLHFGRATKTVVNKDSVNPRGSNMVAPNVGHLLGVKGGLFSDLRLT